ncbi:MAG: glutamate--tRNA ligase family protein [Candidatus Andersenbacteria bacterium]
MPGSEKQVRVRIAPSPTGNLHVGTVRAALFNELFARHHGGSFIIRIEDTDKARSRPEFERNILEGLAWLGIEWQEGPDKDGSFGPYRQSERIEHYRAALQALLDQDKAYYDETANNVIRLRVAPQEVRFTDLIRGEIITHTDSWGGDFVIARDLKDPVFHLAVVVDDAAQQISHVIRGEDHISNTARHLLLQQALNLPTPHYAHLPLLLDEHRRKLSKRAGEVSVLTYQQHGYLPDALLNYLALLGWNPKNDQEYFTHEELIRNFNLPGIQKGGAVFSLVKLQGFNKYYLRQLSPPALLAAAEPYLRQAGIAVDNTAYWQSALQTEQERVSTLQELGQAVAFFAPDWQGDFPGTLLIWKKSDRQQTRQILEKLAQFLETLPEPTFTVQSLHDEIMNWLETEQLGRGDTLWPLRVALTGREHSPGPFEVAAVLGKQATLQRIAQALEKLL